MMKKRLLSLFLALCLCAALLPAAVLAEDVVIDLNQKKLDGLLGEAHLVSSENNSYSYEKPLPAGNYRLTETIKTKASIVIEGNVTLDLNGKQLILDDTNALCGAIRVIGENASLTLTDSSKEQSGAIASFRTGDHNPLGGGVYVDGGSFIMNGGTIDGCSGQHGGGGVYLTGRASFTMNDGVIRGCKASERASGGGVYVGADCTFVMEDGVIDLCESLLGSGGGVYVTGTFRMNGGEIRGCVTEGDPIYIGDGGGVYVARGGTFEMSGGSIENCRTGYSGSGGGVYVGGTFTMTGGTIKNNQVNKNWDGEGAGVYVADDADATLITANITGNTKTDGTSDDITAPGGYTEYEPPVEPEDPDYPLICILPLAKNQPFADVKSTDWFYSDVAYVYESGLMTGTSDTAFSPDAPVTRGMVLTILARQDGIRTERYEPWYAAGCEWAVLHGVSDGTNPEAPVTREQLAAMLYRFAKLKGYDLTGGTLDAFADGAAASAYAREALGWAAAQTILTGANGRLDPQGTATRAQLAAILHRFLTK